MSVFEAVLFVEALGFSTACVWMNGQRLKWQREAERLRYREELRNRRP